jgi:hypothetical protein
MRRIPLRATTGELAKGLWYLLPMITDMPHTAAKRPEYPSGKWHRDVDMSQGFRGRLTYLLRQPQMRFWSLFFVAAILCAPLSFLLYGPGSLMSVSTSVIFLIGAAIAGLTIYTLVQSGRAVEGLIVSVTDDGIDRLYAVYYEDGPASYQMDFAAKRKSGAGQLQRGDTLTLVVGRPPGLLPQALILRPL